MKNPDFKFKHKRVTILGGTGTLGKALTSKIHEVWPDVQVTILSRDEHKQAVMKREFPKCQYVIGDIRDRRSLGKFIAGRDIVFHVAALKHIDIAEANPVECIRTNVDGTINAAEIAYTNGVQRFIFSSTDKAVDPINTYGSAKYLSERYLYNFNLIQSSTKFSVYRWGNVLGSQGSAIPLFAETLLRERKAYITHPDMTRFWIPIDWATAFMLHTFNDSYSDKAMVPPTMKAASVIELIAAISNILGIKDYGLITTGIRPGEKIHEAIYSQHSEHPLTSDKAPRYTQDELIRMLRPIILNQVQARSAA